MRLTIIVLVLMLLFACNRSRQSMAPQAVSIEKSQVRHTTEKITIDGKASEKSWGYVGWNQINQVWLGKDLSAQDFAGRYKLQWDENYLYVLAEIKDDTLIDINADPLYHYWDDDCLEVFIDEDASGGNHQYSHNAFAYHISLDNEVVDIGPDSLFRTYPHIRSARKDEGNTSLWELAISIYDDTYVDDKENQKVRLGTNKQMGFAIAYCDNDHSTEREHFIGSEYVAGEDKNRGWIDAGIFGQITLK